MPPPLLHWQVAPADLSFHVRDAVNVAGAQRIGHGVDIPWEEAATKTVATMASKPVGRAESNCGRGAGGGCRKTPRSALQRGAGHAWGRPPSPADQATWACCRPQVAVEINILSNSFILGETSSQHPLAIYHAAGVPLVISSDDPAILRNTLTSNFVALAKGWPSIKCERRLLGSRVPLLGHPSMRGGKRGSRALIWDLQWQQRQAAAARVQALTPCSHQPRVRPWPLGAPTTAGGPPSSSSP